MIQSELLKIIKLWKYDTSVKDDDVISDILNLFNQYRRYHLSYLDGDMEREYDVWAKDNDDALDKLSKICPHATYIFLTKL